jgi:hypothetical protein
VESHRPRTIEDEGVIAIARELRSELKAVTGKGEELVTKDASKGGAAA